MYHVTRDFVELSIGHSLRGMSIFERVYFQALIRVQREVTTLRKYQDPIIVDSTDVLTRSSTWIVLFGPLLGIAAGQKNGLRFRVYGRTTEGSDSR